MMSVARAPEESKADNFHVNGDVGCDVGHLVDIGILPQFETVHPSRLEAEF